MPLCLFGQHLVSSCTTEQVADQILFKKLNSIFDHLSFSSLDALPMPPLRMYVRALYEGNNLVQEGLPVYGDLKKIETKVVYYLRELGHILSCPASDKTALSMNISYSVITRKNDYVVIWWLEIMKELPLGSGRHSTSIETSLWNNYRIQVIAKNCQGNVEKWFALKDLLHSLEKAIAERRMSPK